MCRCWRDALEAADHWRVLDFSAAGGVQRNGSPELLRAAVLRAHGCLEALTLPGDVDPESHMHGLLGAHTLLALVFLYWSRGAASAAKDNR